MDSRTHRLVKEETRRARNTVARARRGAEPGRGGVRILRATDECGTAYTLALADAEPDRAYVLRRDRNGAWTCACLTYRLRGDCAHVQAAATAQQDAA